MIFPSSEQRIADLCGVLAGARSAIAVGARIDLAGLDLAVDEAMQAALEAPATERTLIIAALNAFIDELDQLSAELHRQYHAEAQSRAAAVYRPEPGHSHAG